MLHYAYGSNLSPTFLKGYCPSAKFVMKAYLSNFRARGARMFPSKSERSSKSRSYA